MGIYDDTCWTCKHFWEDKIVGACECLCEEITEEELDKYFTDDEKGCPHHEEEEV